ncbi:hypothetical protein BDP27DRAFT_1371979 [Rhodocollybia butyracea]|uniref:Uncharacterized protein n=1 Tax=Rhodocollybia butyracea TaxID=206335 RepID=A0A9P5P905_9AGAR|nr:hypothetical protein BDP27DRAFT_1371979 [Rhodocollybia butyracea]
MAMSADRSTESELDQKSHLFLVLMGPDFIVLIFVVLFYGCYTILFSLYIYLQIQHRGRKHYYQIAVLLLYMLATTALILAILIFYQEGLVGLFPVVVNDSIASEPKSEPAQSHDLMFEKLEIFPGPELLKQLSMWWRICFVNTVLALSAVVLEQKNIVALRQALNTGENSLLVTTTSDIAFSFLALRNFTYGLLQREGYGGSQRQPAGGHRKQIAGSGGMIIV